MINCILLLPFLLPAAAGVLLALLKFKKRASMLIYVFIILAAEAALCIFVSASGTYSLELLNVSQSFVLYFTVDTLSKVFLILVSCMWLLAGVFSFEYMEHDGREKLFYGVYLVTGGVLAMLCLSGNLVTFYVFYELMSLVSMPLVLHERTHEAVMAALKYLFYSMAGALLALFGIFVLSYSGGGALVFTAGGLDVFENPTALTYTAVFMLILGFGAKAGMFPLHAWLPSAHPVAPASASAVLSGVITKAGVLGVIRAIYYIAGAQAIKGTWVQSVWIILSLVTVFMGSMLAYKEKILKKRLAYSTVSQVSYVMFGLSLLNEGAFLGALLHVIFHSLAKNTLFMSAGAIIHKTGKTRVDELKGTGKQMPCVMWCFLLASLSLVGIPPLAGFVSKWYLAVGSLESGISTASWLGPLILLVSALLTAGYLLPICINAFLPGRDFEPASSEKKEPSWLMLLPLFILSAFSLILGIWPSALTGILADIASAVL